MMKLLVFFALIAFANCQLKCYDCAPKDTGNCKNPQDNKIELTTCDADVTTCFTLNFKPNADNAEDEAYQEGYYRGCGTNKDYCDKSTNIQTLKTKGTVNSCDVCTEEGCNKGGAASIKVASFLIIATICFSFLKF